ncbi:MAG: hypothetical protein JJLCMIEE_01202 [Acidimicrobiales bacterium]|nr:MAG: alpha/beta hydrolase [Actinomycetota bacterium]MBV6508142.1 hypothetical protein [Acidimicrobiales bacterium]RIK03887.1 MAG: alpha/beta hydrolase [Acidobacteriota bacterium]
MVMGKRCDVETAGLAGTIAAIGGLGSEIGRELLRSTDHLPWQGPNSPPVNLYREGIRRVLKGMFNYSATCDVPQLRSLEVVIDDISGVMLPLPWRRPFVNIDHGVDFSGVPCDVVSPRGGERNGVVLYFHGGGYVATTPRMYGGLVTRLALDTGCEVVVPDYRLAPEFPFPAGLDDVRLVYSAVREKYQPEDIIVAGDSGGGGLAASFLVSLKMDGEAQPAGGILLSPEIDLTMRRPSIAGNATTDILPDHIPVDPYLHGIDPHDPLVSPIYADPRSFPPLLVTAGDEEMFADQIKAFVKRVRDAGGDVWFFDAPDLFHVFEIVLPWTRGSDHAFSDITAFVDQRLAVD